MPRTFAYTDTAKAVRTDLPAEGRYFEDISTAAETEHIQRRRCEKRSDLVNSLEGKEVASTFDPLHGARKLGGRIGTGSTSLFSIQQSRKWQESILVASACSLDFGSVGGVFDLESSFLKFLPDLVSFLKILCFSCRFSFLDECLYLFAQHNLLL